MIQLEVGTRYVRRDGKVTGPLRWFPGCAFPFVDEKSKLSYMTNGQYFWDDKHHADLVAEYSEAHPSDYDHLGDLQREHNEMQNKQAMQDCWAALRDMVSDNQEMGFYDTKDSNPKDSIGCTKPPLHTIPTGPLFEAGAVLLHGHCKYRGYNWRVAGVRNSIYYDAVMRHMMAWWEGEDTDPDSGLPHIAHAIAGLCVLRDSQMIGNCTDDRPPRRQHPFNALRPLVAEMAQKPQPEPYTEQNTAQVKP